MNDSLQRSPIPSLSAFGFGCKMSVANPKTTMNTTEHQVATLLHDKGKIAHDEFCRAFDGRLTRLGLNDLFEACIAESLTWTEHAHPSDGFVRDAVAYLITGDAGKLTNCGKFALAYGPQSLMQILQGWHSLKRHTGNVDWKRDGAADLVRAQQSALAAQSSSQKSRGIGAWTFCGPFKLVALYRRDLWKDVRLDDLLMPLGKPLIRGVKALLQNGYTFGSNLQAADLSETEGSFLEGMATTALVHDYTQKIAAVVGERVAHINTGFHLLGDKQISL